jgi:pyruvate/2-oxoglutarate/acetoin dehydrogenase E1 component/TPP-dependent pyruvate/acetoin dehydrogenase alpha subunit
MTLTSTSAHAVREASRDVVLHDYRIGVRGRQVALVGRQEVLSGKAKFGIFGDGKEVAHLAMASVFQHGDVRSGYYRDLTFMLALGVLNLDQVFAQIYAHADLQAEPFFGGRLMTGHFATRYLDASRWVDQTQRYNSAADLSPTAAQMPKLVGLAEASKVYRQLGGSLGAGFSTDGDEVAFGTIGNASCAQGLFWESINAIGVLQVPAVVAVWDDGYGISVPNEYQVTKGDLGKILEGFRPRAGETGVEVYRVRGWDYPALCQTFRAAVGQARRDHQPSVVHVVELTQPSGHSTSGSHERYKSEERLEWEQRFDGLRQMRRWMLEAGLATEAELEQIMVEERAAVRQARDRAYAAYREFIDHEKRELLDLLGGLSEELGPRASASSAQVQEERKSLERRAAVLRRDLLGAAQRALLVASKDRGPGAERLMQWRRLRLQENERRYGSDLYSEGPRSALRVPAVPPEVPSQPAMRNGFEILNAAFDAAFAREPRLLAMGEDIGRLGDVNQGFARLQEKYGEVRVADTGIREATIVGQAIGLAMRGLRPIAEVQYLDYILYALQILSDDLATLRWRTCGGQAAPVILRTRGHRLEGVWHSGSPMAGVINLCRGLIVCVPRDATRAVGFYNTLLRSDDAGMVVEVLNAYRAKEPMPSNLGELTVPVGVPEVLRAGRDVTVVTYGPLCGYALQASEDLSRLGIDIEVIDVQTLLPFDRAGSIVDSLRRTHRVLFLDEDVPGGTTAYMLERVLVEQNGYYWLDAPPRTLSATEHRPAYGSDGDYFSKPSRDSIVAEIYSMMREAEPRRFPELL